MEFPKFIHHIYNYTADNGRTQYSRIKVEPTASGKPAYQVLKKSSLNISEYSYPSKSKLERLHAIAPKVEAMKVALVEGPWNDLFLDQVTANSPNHDDIRDCFVMAVEDQLIKRSNGGKYSISLL
jgi:phage terminase large subunit-like protein